MRDGTSLAILAALGLLAAGVRAEESTERVSVGSAGQQGGGASSLSARPAVSANGRFVVFNSVANNLVPNDLAMRDVFVHDRRANTTEVVSVDTSFRPVGGSSQEAISPDGLWVAFGSASPNVTDVPVPPGVHQIYLRDRTGHTHLVSLADSGVYPSTPGNADSNNPAVSAAGRFVVFSSKATNLASGTQGIRQIYLRDMATYTTELLSVADDGTPGNGESDRPAISDDGRFVAFDSVATNLVLGDRNGAARDVFVRDRLAGSTRLLSVSSAGVQSVGYAWFPSISADGRFVAFEGNAADLAPDCPGTCAFLRDRQTGVTETVSVSSVGSPADGVSGAGGAMISADGRFVTFYSRATNLDPHDTNGDYDVFVRDRVLGSTRRVSVSTSGVEGDARSFSPSISRDGTVVAYESWGSTLVSDDTNQSADVFVHDTPAELPPCGGNLFPECNGACPSGFECTAAAWMGTDIDPNGAGCYCVPAPACGASPFPMCQPDAKCPRVQGEEGPYDLECVPGPTGCICANRPASDLPFWGPKPTATCSCPGVAQAGQRFSVEIQISTYSPQDPGYSWPLGAYSARLTYDPAVVTIASIAGGRTPEFYGFPVTDPATFASGGTDLVAYQTDRTDGPTGTVSVATVTFNTLGASDFSSIGLAVEAWDTFGHVIEMSGTATCTIAVPQQSVTTTTPTTTTTSTTLYGAQVFLECPTAVTFQPGSLFDIELKADVGPTPLGSYWVELEYGVPNVVGPYSVRGGTTQEFSGAPSWNPVGSGVTVLTSQESSLVSPTGVVSLAFVTLRVVDAYAGPLPIWLGIQGLRDTRGNPIAAIPVSCTISVAGTTTSTTFITATTSSSTSTTVSSTSSSTSTSTTSSTVSSTSSSTSTSTTTTTVSSTSTSTTTRQSTTTTSTTTSTTLRRKGK